jgi:hypothetical protein
VALGLKFIDKIGRKKLLQIGVGGSLVAFSLICAL